MNKTNSIMIKWSDRLDGLMVLCLTLLNLDGS